MSASHRRRSLLSKSLMLIVLRLRQETSKQINKLVEIMIRQNNNEIGMCWRVSIWHAYDIESLWSLPSEAETSKKAECSPDALGAAYLDSLDRQP